VLPKDCRRLAEVDFPIAEVSRHSAREKSIRHGHPSTLHLWWARRPLAACRAVLLTLLLPDPCDSLCPPAFKEKARTLLAAVPRQMRPAVEPPTGCNRDDYELRRALLGFIAAFANWDHAANFLFIETARELVRAAHPEPPLVVDPFAGGGSIPLEALRVGCEAFASDLNPVACLILKVLVEEIPRYGRAKIKVPTADGHEEVEGLAAAVRRVGALVKARAERELAEFYPPDPDRARPIAYLWARTVRCEAPNCGAEIPLARSFWLSKKTGRRRALRYRIGRPAGRPPETVFEIFDPKSEAEVPRGTVSRGNATCPACGTVLRVERVRAQLSAQRGGADATFDEGGRRIGGARLLAVVTVRPGEPGRHYRLPTERDYEAVRLLSLLRQVPGIHRAFCRVTRERCSFMPAERFELRRAKNQVYARMVVLRHDQDVLETLPQIRVRRAFRRIFHQVASPNAQELWFETEPVPGATRATDTAIRQLSARVCKVGIWPILTDKGQKCYLSTIPPREWLPPLASIYAIMFYLGSITRYKPYDFDRIVAGRFTWLIGEFLKTQPAQFVYGVAAHAAGVDVVRPYALLE